MINTLTLPGEVIILEKKLQKLDKIIAKYYRGNDKLSYHLCNAAKILYATYEKMLNDLLEKWALYTIEEELKDG